MNEQNFSGHAYVRRLAFFALMALSVAVLMGKANDQSLQAMDSSYHARLALRATAGRVAPVLPIRDARVEPEDPGFNDHPVTLFYVNGWVMRWLGADAWSARLLPSAFAVGSVALVVWLGSLLYSFPAGILAGLILMTTKEFVSFGARFQLDPALVFFILLSFAWWWKGWPLRAGIAAGIGIWFKSPVALLLFPSVFLSSLAAGKLRRPEFNKLCLSALVALFVGAMVWIAEGWLGGWDLVRDYWTRQVFGTAVGGRGDSSANNHFLWAEELGRRYYPWLFLLLVSLVALMRKGDWRRREILLPTAAALVVIVVISSMRFQFSHYFLPMYPFLALVAVAGVQGWIQKYETGLYRFVIGAALLFPAILLATPLPLSPERFPALRKFLPIVQSYGSCEDHMLFIEGGQPYGSFGDYGVEVQFYANRKMLWTTCDEANARVAKDHPGWILVNGENLARCLSPAVLREFPVRYQYGKQFLLTNRVPAEKALDLTPLARELRAPLDCAPVPLKSGRYVRY